MSKAPKAQVPPGRRQSSAVGIDFAELVALAQRLLPGIELGSSYNTPSLKVKGKVMARHRTEAEGGLMLRSDFLDRAMLMQAAPEVFYITEHYREYPCVLINLARVRVDALPQLLEASWRMVAPAPWIAAFDAGEPLPPARTPGRRRT